MLVPFHFDKNFFDSKSFKDSEIGKFFLTSYANVWKDYGVLVLPNSVDFKTYWNLTKAGSPAYLQQDLLILFSHRHKFKFRHSQHTWNEGNIYCEDVNQYILLKNYFFALFVDECVYDFLSELPCFSKYDPINNFEVLKPFELNDSIIFEKAKKISFSEISTTDTNSSIWIERFEKLSFYSQNITIIDRYFTQNVISDIKNSLTTSIDFFISNLPNNQSINLSIISVMGNNNNRNFKKFKMHILNIINSDINIRNKFSSIKLISSTDGYFKDNSHDRYLIFDEKVFRVGKGMCIFSTHPMHPMTFNIVEKSSNDSMRITKARLPQHCLYEERII